MATVAHSFEKALQHHRTGDLERAESLYREIVRIDPGHADAFHLLGVAAHQQNQNQTAVDYIHRAISINETAPSYHGNLGFAYRAMGRLPEAIAAFRESVRLDSTFADGWINLGKLLAVQNRFDEAVECFKQLVTLHPEHTESRSLLGKALEQQGELSEALDVFQNAIQFFPDDPELHFGLGHVYLSCNDFQKAQPSYERGLEIVPENVGHLKNLGCIYNALGRHSKAIDCLQKAIQIDPAYAPAHFYLGNVLIEQSRPAEAADCFRQAIRIRPDYSEAHVRLGAVLLSEDEIDEAERCINEALRLNPNAIDAWMSLGLIFKKRGESEKAQDAYQRATLVAPQHMLPHMTLGRFLHSQGKLEEAVSSLRNAAEMASEDEKPRYYLGNVYKDSGKYAEAVSAYREALEISPDFFAAYYELGNTYRHLKQYEQARDCYRQAIQINPYDYSVLISLGNVLKTMDCIDESRACYRKVIKQIPDRPHWKLWTATLCPLAFSQNGEIDEFRLQLHETLQQLAETRNLLTPEEISQCGCPPPYQLQFHGRDDRRLKEAYAYFFRDFIPPERPPAGVGMPKIGFVVTNGHEGVFLRYLLGVLERLNHKQFELVILCSAAGRERMRPEISSDSIRLLVMPHNFSSMLEAIRDAKFDVLYHWEVGSDVNNYFLPFFWLAPVQCTSVGILETSGIRQIDYYLSPDIVEPAEAQDHYSETLLRTRTLLSYHTRLQLPAAVKNREQFGFRQNQHLYFCPHKIQKLHPDMDPLFAGILQQDTHGIVVIPEDISGFAARNLRGRFKKTISEASHRIIFVPYLTFPDYLSLTAVADVLLDPIYYGGGLTAYDGFSLNQATVTLPTRFARGRFTYGLYRQMGMTDCVVTTPEEFVQQAVRLGSDRNYRETILQKLREKSEGIFEDITIVREYERIFQKLVDEARWR